MAAEVSDSLFCLLCNLPCFCICLGMLSGLPDSANIVSAATLHSDHSFCSNTIQIHSFCSDTSFRSQFLQRHFIQITVSAATLHSDHSFCSDTSFRSQFLQRHFIQITVSAATLHSDHSFCSDTSFRSQFLQ